ncbi:hypothetical protein KR018_009780 [Drosophila ironensis]|nr:hypothetical protein KR018_009780 [Drosophila ironensis]
MDLALGQSEIEQLPLGMTVVGHSASEESPEYQDPSARSGLRSCRNCIPVYPKKKYYVLPQKSCNSRRHNNVFLVKNRKTGRLMKVAFMNGLKNKRKYRILKAYQRSRDPCGNRPGRVVYRLLNRKTGNPIKADITRGLKNKKRVRILKFS